MILLLIQLYKHIKTHEEKHAQTQKAVISNSKLPNNHIYCYWVHLTITIINITTVITMINDRVCPQSNAGQVHPSHRGEVGHTEPQLEREIQIVSDYCAWEYPPKAFACYDDCYSHS